MRGLAILSAVAGCAVALWNGPALALNWEGHDDWFLDDPLSEAFARQLPPPIVKPMPLCSERAAAVKDNPYEQVAVAGINCRPDRVVPKK